MINYKSSRPNIMIIINPRTTSKYLQLSPSLPKTNLPNPPPQNGIHLLRLLPQRPMRCIHLLNR